MLQSVTKLLLTPSLWATSNSVLRYLKMQSIYSRAWIFWIEQLFAIIASLNVIKITVEDMFTTLYYEQNMFSLPSELPENPVDIFPLYYMDSDAFNRFKSS